MTDFFSTFYDPLGFGFGKLATGKDSSIVNIDKAYTPPKAPDGSQKANEVGAPQPSIDTASETANDDLTKSRRALLATGGETTLTGIGGAPLLGSQTTSKSLLGGS